MERQIQTQTRQEPSCCSEGVGGRADAWRSVLVLGLADDMKQRTQPGMWDLGDRQNCVSIGA